MRYNQIINENTGVQDSPSVVEAAITPKKFAASNLSKFKPQSIFGDAWTQAFQEVSNILGNDFMVWASFPAIAQLKQTAFGKPSRKFEAVVRPKDGQQPYPATFSVSANGDMVVETLYDTALSGESVTLYATKSGIAALIASAPVEENIQLDEWNTRMRNGWAILPATMDLYGKRTVDLKTAASEWKTGEETILICQKSGETRFLFLASSGGPDGWSVGETRECFHDQKQTSKGMYTVMNVVGFTDGEITYTANDIGLNARASVAVFK